jgi:hypothetical protein
MQMLLDVSLSHPVDIPRRTLRTTVLHGCNLSRFRKTCEAALRVLEHAEAVGPQP